MNKDKLQKLLEYAKINKEKIIALAKDKGDDLDEVPRFLKIFNIKEGKYKVYATNLYNAYYLWSGVAMKKAEFLEEFSLIFDLQKIGNGKEFYMLNQRAPQLTRKAEKLKVTNV